MGKGAGKGSCNGNSAAAFKTKEGECASSISAFVLCMESLGGLINCFPAWCMCYFPCCGCCWCFLVMLSSGGGIFGGSAPQCCGRTAANLSILYYSSIASFVIRGVVIGALSALISTLNDELEEYDDCRREQPDGERKSEKYCEDQDLIRHQSRDQQALIVGWATFGLVVTCIWILVSVIGAYYGKLGYDAELKAEQDARINGGVPAPAGITVGTATGGRVVVAQAQAIPVHLVQPVVQIQAEQRQQQQTNSEFVTGTVVQQNPGAVSGTVMAQPSAPISGTAVGDANQSYESAMFGKTQYA